MSEKNPIARMLGEKTTMTVKGTDLHYQIRALSPTEAVRLQVSMSMLMGAAAKPTEGTEATEGITDDQAVDLVGRMEKLACAVVLAARKPKGRQWHDLRLVPDFDLQDLDKNWVFVGSISPNDVAAIAHQCTAHFRRAAEMAAPFPE